MSDDDKDDDASDIYCKSDMLNQCAWIPITLYSHFFMVWGNRTGSKAYNVNLFLQVCWCGFPWYHCTLQYCWTPYWWILLGLIYNIFIDKHNHRVLWLLVSLFLHYEGECWPIWYQYHHPNSSDMQNGKIRSLKLLAFLCFEKYQA